MPAAALGHCDCNVAHRDGDPASDAAFGAMAEVAAREVVMSSTRGRGVASGVGLLVAMTACSSSRPPTPAVSPEVERTSVVSMSSPPAAPSPSDVPTVRPPAPRTEPRAAETCGEARGGKPNVAVRDARASAERPDATMDDVEAILAAVTDGSREASRLAERRGEDPRVRRFAGDLLAEQRRGERRAKGAPAEGASRVDTTASMRLRTTTDQSLAALEKQRGHVFDRSFVTFQAALRRDALSALDEDVGPRVRAPEVEARWAQVRARLLVESEKAEALVGELAPSPAADAGR